MPHLYPVRTCAHGECRSDCLVSLIRHTEKFQGSQQGSFTLPPIGSCHAFPCQGIRPTQEEGPQRPCCLPLTCTACMQALGEEKALCASV